MTFENTYVILEIPEFRGMNLTDKFSKIKVSGFETEKPIVRLDDYVFQGKWFFSKNSIFFSISKNFKEKNEATNSLFSFLFLKNKKNPRFFIKSCFSNQLNFFSKKRLRLHRLPLGILKN